MAKRENPSGRLMPFVPLIKSTLETPAWRSLSHGARSLYVALKARYSSNLHNNGRIFLSQREAAKALGSHHDQIVRWFRELSHYGFIVQTKSGSLGVEGRGKAPHWRLTELGYMREAPSRDFDKWGGREKFRLTGKTPPPKAESRAGLSARGVREMRHTIEREIQHTEKRKRAGKAAHMLTSAEREIPHITSLPLSGLRPDISSVVAASPDDVGIIDLPQFLGLAGAKRSAPPKGAVASERPRNDDQGAAA